METNGHQWRAIMVYDVTVEDADRMFYPGTGQATEPRQIASDERPALDDPTPFLGLHNLERELSNVACLKCEHPYSRKLAEIPCPGDPDGYNPTTSEPLWGGKPHPLRDVEATPVAFYGVGRNDPCPCGSGEKFKRCHGA